MEEVLVAMAILVMKETSVVKVALVAVVVEEYTVAVGKAAMDLVMTEAMWEVVEATTILAATTFNLQILDPGSEKTLAAKALAPVVVGTKTAKPQNQGGSGSSSSSSSDGSG
ncbi:hypothetical protein H920_08463 [Fukomys damarensis]|uniref:Uncharacterized protein n=1 Tax=Fukomys damarensis TaxID=885580 RepID=A0A091E4U7_FUKDA|nr:hypothetical protein H920_08463 [Fukomys damarensis]